jgi:hypothetical protein
LPPGPGTILVQVHGAADGDTSTGQGAIVYDRTATQATFDSVSKTASDFILHQTANVTAHRSATFRFGYAQAYKAADVASLASYAAAVFKGCTVPKVAGKTLAAAKKAITHAGCAVGKISHAHSAKVGTGRVISEKPKAGSHVAYHARVSLLVSEGS